jgi:hypothetical protein
VIDTLTQGASFVEINALLQQDCELCLIELMSFYMGLVGHIQIVSIYEGLKLLLTLLRG